MKCSWVLLGVAFAGLALANCMAGSLTVDVAVKPGDPWKPSPTRTLSDLRGFQGGADGKLDEYGGLSEGRAAARGFFYATNMNGRWWLVDPAGGLFIHKGIASVTPLKSEGARLALEKKFGTEEKWAARTTELLQEHAFNGAGAWSDTEGLRHISKPLVCTRIWNFMSSYGKKRGGTYQQPGHTGYPKDCIFVFDPQFETFCDEHARQLVAGKNDPWLLGHFSDNELPLKREALNSYLQLPEKDPGYQAAIKWLRQRHGASAAARDITEKDQQDFLAVVVDRYFRVVSAAIRKADPNHLFLGARFHGAALRFPEVFSACGPYVDVVSVNYYRAWTPDPEKLNMWARESGKPVIITEWYAKGADSGLGNTTGAGWLVKTQKDRGLFYQNFTLALLESRQCVGWHWFKYIDNDPADTRADPSNQDSNKGIVNNRYEPYQPLLDQMNDVNLRAYSLIDYFDRSTGKGDKQ